MIEKLFATVRFIVALFAIVGLNLQGIQLAYAAPGMTSTRIRMTRRAGAEGSVSLAKRRRWFAKSTVASMAGLFNKIYEDAMFVARDNNLMAQLVTPYSAQGYADRVLPIYPQLSAQEVAEGVDYSNATEWTKASEATFTPKEVMTQVILTDRRIQTDPDNARNDAAREMGGAIATRIDEDLVSEFANFDSDKGTAGSALTVKRCAAGLALLQNNKVRGTKYFVLHPYGWFDIWTELGQPATNQAFLGETANQAMRDYAVMQMLGAQWFTSANIAISSSNAVSGVFVREALALDTREAPSMEVERDASLRAYELNMHAGYATGVRRSEYGVALTHDATEPTG